MKKSKISEVAIVAAIKEHEARKAAADICRTLGVHQTTLHLEKEVFGNG